MKENNKIQEACLRAAKRLDKYPKEKKKALRDKILKKGK
jgi:hypothetical protein